MQSNNNYHLQYLGRKSLPNNSTGLGAVQEPLLELYSAFKTDKGVTSLKPVRLSLAESGIRVTTDNFDESFQLASIFLCQPIKFCSEKIKAKQGIGFAFKVISQNEANAGLLALPKKLSYLDVLRHPPLLVCIMRRSTGVQAPHVYAFVCQSNEESINICNFIKEAHKKPEGTKAIFNYKPYESNAQSKAPPETKVIPKNQMPVVPTQQNQPRASASASVRVMSTGKSSLDIAREFTQCPERYVEDVKMRQSVMLKKSDRSSSFVIPNTKSSSASQRQSSGFMLNQKDLASMDGSEQSHSLKLFHFTDVYDHSTPTKKEVISKNVQNNAEKRTISENEKVNKESQAKGPQRQSSIDGLLERRNDAQQRSENIYMNDHMKAQNRKTTYLPNIDRSEFEQANKNSKPVAMVQPSKFLGVRVLPDNLSEISSQKAQLKSTPLRNDQLADAKKDNVIYTKVNQDKSPIIPSPTGQNNFVKDVKKLEESPNIRNDQNQFVNQKSDPFAIQRSKSSNFKTPNDKRLTKISDFEITKSDDARKTSSNNNSFNAPNILPDSTLPACGTNFMNYLGYLP